MTFDINDTRTPVERIEFQPMTVTGDNTGDYESRPESGEILSKYVLHGFPLASVYAPVQEWEDLYEPEQALERGTMFAGLDLPFTGSCYRGGNFRE